MTFLGFAHAQTFKVSAGYGFPWITQPIGTNTSTTATTTIDPGTSNENSTDNLYQQKYKRFVRLGLEYRRRIHL